MATTRIGQLMHKIIKVNGVLKPVCMPKDPRKWTQVRADLVNCSHCLSGRQK